MLYLIYTKVLQILNYKCDECEFWGPNTLTMEVHVKKFHCETITCDLCEYEAPDIGNLETHQVTCEIYQCSECKKLFRTLSEMKEHVKKEHDGKHTWIEHLKSDRKFTEFLNAKLTLLMSSLGKRPKKVTGIVLFIRHC